MKTMLIALLGGVFLSACETQSAETAGDQCPDGCAPDTSESSASAGGSPSGDNASNGDSKEAQAPEGTKPAPECPEGCEPETGGGQGAQAGSGGETSAPPAGGSGAVASGGTASSSGGANSSGGSGSTGPGVVIDEDCVPAEQATAPMRTSAASGLSYICLLVGGATKGEKVPWGLSIHGLKSEPLHMAPHFRNQSYKARIYLPRGPNVFDTGYEWFGAPPYGDLAPFKAGAESAASSLLKLIEEVGAQNKNVGLPVMTGYSQGGILSTYLTAFHNDKVRGAAFFAGMLPEGMRPTVLGTARPVRAFHGEADPTLTLEQAQATYNGMKTLGHDVVLKTYEGLGHGMSDTAKADLEAAIGALLTN